LAAAVPWPFHSQLQPLVLCPFHVLFPCPVPQTRRFHAEHADVAYPVMCVFVLTADDALTTVEVETVACTVLDDCTMVLDKVRLLLFVMALKCSGYTNGLLIFSFI